MVLNFRLVGPQLPSFRSFDSTKKPNDTIHSLWVHIFSDSNFVGPLFFEMQICGSTKNQTPHLSKKMTQKIRGNSRKKNLGFGEPSRFLMNCDAFPNVANIRKHNNVPMIFWFFSFRLNLCFIFFLQEYQVDSAQIHLIPIHPRLKKSAPTSSEVGRQSCTWQMAQLKRTCNEMREGSEHTMPSYQNKQRMQHPFSSDTPMQIRGN